MSFMTLASYCDHKLYFKDGCFHRYISFTNLNVGVLEPIVISEQEDGVIS